MRHGYKGAFEMAATVDYLFAFAATADCVADHHFDAVFDAYLGDDAVRGFIESRQPGGACARSPPAAGGAGARLWKSRSNTAFGKLQTGRAGVRGMSEPNQTRTTSTAGLTRNRQSARRRATG